MDKISIHEVKYDPDIYPRSKWNTNTIEQYADAMKAGDRFPPIILEAGTNRLLDGMHRWKAQYQYLAEYRQNLELDQPKSDFAPIDETINVEFHTIPDGIPAKLYAASLSVNHGLRIGPSERKQIAREIFEDNPDFTLEAIRKYLGISIGTASNYVADIRARREEQQRMIAYRLHLLGWTQEEIGDVIEVSQQYVQQKFLQQFSELKKVVKNLASGGLPYLDIAERHNMALILVWATVLAGKTDAERMDALNIRPRPYDVWNFGKCHDLFGSSHPGRIPGELAAHVLYFFTEPGDMVIDPMSGSGTTQDVCLAMGRKCYGFDIDGRHNRKDTIIHDIAKDGWHKRVKKADLIFWDPPYFQKMDADYIEGSISSMNAHDYVGFFNQRLFEAAEVVRPGTRIAFLMSDWDDGNGDGLFLWDYASIMQSAGWKLTRQIQAPLPTEQVHPDIINKFRASKRLARLERYLLIGVKE